MTATARPDRAAKRIPAPRDCDGLTQGEWVTRHGVRVWVEHICPDCGGHLLPRTRCDTCLTWAVKNARDTEWARISKAERHVIWAILEARNERKRAA